MTVVEITSIFKTLGISLRTLAQRTGINYTEVLQPFYQHRLQTLSPRHQLALSYVSHMHSTEIPFELTPSYFRSFLVRTTHSYSSLAELLGVSDDRMYKAYTAKKKEDMPRLPHSVLLAIFELARRVDSDQTINGTWDAFGRRVRSDNDGSKNRRPRIQIN